jgi:hypothetical protein
MCTADDFMQPSPYSEVYGCSANPEIIHLLWSMRVHYNAHNNPPLLPPWYTWIRPTFFRTISVRSVSIFFSHLQLGLRSGFRSLFLDQNFVCISHLFRECYIPRPSHHFIRWCWLYLVKSTNYEIILFSPASCYFSVFFFQALSVYVLPLMGQTRVHVRKGSGPLMSVLWNYSKFVPALAKWASLIQKNKAVN